MSSRPLSRVLAGAAAVSLGLTTAALGGAAQAANHLPVFGYDQGWRVERHIRTLADVNRDGYDDVVAFGESGVLVGYGRETGPFATIDFAVGNFGYEQGWRVDQHPRELADVNADGRVDIVGFGDAGTWVSHGRADGTFAPAALTVRDFGRNQGWEVERHPRKVVDVDGDGAADIVGFGYGGVRISYARADGTFTAPVLAVRDFGWSQGWRGAQNPREVADVDGDGAADIVGFGYGGVRISHAGAGGGFVTPVLALRDFGQVQGWSGERHVRTVADVSGDGRADVVGFGDAGVLVADGRPGPALGSASLRIRDLGWNQGWRVGVHPRLLADVQGNGRPYVVGFGQAGTYVTVPDPGGVFNPVRLAVAEFGIAQGWRPDRHPRLVGDVWLGNGPDAVGFKDEGVYLEPL